MSKRKTIGVFLLFFVSIILTTCELQSNKAGNSLTLQILIPGSASGAAKSTRTLATNAKSLEGGASVQVTILTEAGTPWQSSSQYPPLEKPVLITHLSYHHLERIKSPLAYLMDLGTFSSSVDLVYSANEN